jgi:hypothetical protein
MGRSVFRPKIENAAIGQIGTGREIRFLAGRCSSRTSNRFANSGSRGDGRGLAAGSNRGLDLAYTER